MPLMARPPAPLVQRLMQRDAIDPGPQTRLALKMRDSAKNFDENFLGDIGCVAWVGKDAINQAVEWLLIAGNQPGKGILGTRFQLLHHRSFLGTNADDSCQISHGRSHPKRSFKRIRNRVVPVRFSRNSGTLVGAPEPISGTTASLTLVG